jgi:outer membrane protein
MKKIFSVLSILIITLSAKAQDGTGDLKELINLSFSYFPKFKELGEAVNAGEQRILLAKSNGLPTLSAQGSYRYMHPVSEISIPTGNDMISFQITPNNNYSTMLNASYTLWDFGATKAAVDAAKYGLESAKHNLDYSHSEMAFQVANIYYQIAYLKNAISIEDSVIRFLEDNKKDTEVKLRNGDALRYDVLSIQSSIDQENNRKIALKNSLDKQLALLEYSTGEQVTIKSSTFDFPVVNHNNAENALETAKKNNSEFDLIADRVKLAEAQVRLNQSKAKPSLGLSAGTGYTNGYTPDIDKFKYNYNAGVTLRIPIYEGGKSKAEINIAKSSLEESKYAKVSLENTFLKDIRQILVDIQSNSSSLINSRQQAQQAMEAQKLAQSRFKNGIGTYLELTNASTNVQRAELTNLQYEYQLCIAQLSLARLTGVKYW